MVQLFGFEIGRAKTKDQDDKNKTFSVPQNDDGAVTIQSGSYYGTYVDLDGVVRNEIELITRYREMSMQPELESAIDEIVNEAIANDDSGKGVDLNTDDLKQPDAIKKKITDEFEYLCTAVNVSSDQTRHFLWNYNDPCDIDASIDKFSSSLLAKINIAAVVRHPILPMIICIDNTYKLFLLKNQYLTDFPGNIIVN
jgi:hypothetical protein